MVFLVVSLIATVPFGCVIGKGLRNPNKGVPRVSRRPLRGRYFRVSQGTSVYPTTVGALSHRVVVRDDSRKFLGS